MIVTWFLVLRDFGADVIRVDRAGATFNPDNQSRGKMSIGLNMKEKQGQNILQSLVEKSDVILDPFRPGVLGKTFEFLKIRQKFINIRISYIYFFYFLNQLFKNG